MTNWDKFEAAMKKVSAAFREAALYIETDREGKIFVQMVNECGDRVLEMKGMNPKTFGGDENDSTDPTSH